MDEISKYWRVYQRALISNAAPHNTPPYNEHMLKKYLLKHNLLFARWITDFDCGHETEWYHVIKDEPFDKTSLKAKRRYEVNKGLKNFYTQIIDPVQYRDDIYEIVVDAFSSYPAKYRPSIDKSKFIGSIGSWSKDNIIVIGAFDKTNDELCGFAYLVRNEDYLNYSMHRVRPSEEKKGINAALVFGVLDYFTRLSDCRYITDGERAIRHETKFQDYLIKYFGFRKAYCKLNVIYNPCLKPIVCLLYPFKSIAYKLKNNNFLYNIYCVLEQERIRRSFL